MGLTSHEFFYMSISWFLCFRSEKSFFQPKSGTQPIIYIECVPENGGKNNFQNFLEHKSFFMFRKDKIGHLLYIYNLIARFCPIDTGQSFFSCKKQYSSENFVIYSIGN